LEVDEWDTQPAQKRVYADAPQEYDNPRRSEQWEKDSQADLWDDSLEEDTYEAQPLKLPERQKVAEYEREEY
jgi:hypothetical protein